MAMARIRKPRILKPRILKRAGRRIGGLKKRVTSFARRISGKPEPTAEIIPPFEARDRIRASLSGVDKARMASRIRAIKRRNPVAGEYAEQLLTLGTEEAIEQIDFLFKLNEKELKRLAEDWQKREERVKQRETKA